MAAGWGVLAAPFGSAFLAGLVAAEGALLATEGALDVAAEASEDFGVPSLGICDEELLVDVKLILRHSVKKELA